MFKHALMLKNTRLIHDARCYIPNNFSVLGLMGEFLKLKVDVVIDLLQDDELVIMDLFKYKESSNCTYMFVTPCEQEFIVLCRVLRYVGLSMSKNMKYFPKMLARCFRLPLICRSTLLRLKKQSFYKIKELQDIIDKVLEVHLAVEHSHVIQAGSINDALNKASDELLSDQYTPQWITPRRLSHKFKMYTFKQ